MGWLFHCTDYGRKAFIEERTKTHDSENAKWECLAHSDKKNHLWKVMRLTNKKTGEVSTYIALDLIAKERNGGWGYKDMSEYAGPNYYDCPLKFLAMSDEPTDDGNNENTWAIEWRKKVREAVANKKPKVKLEEGGTYKLYPSLNINGINNLSVKLLYKRNAVSWVAEVFDVNGNMIVGRCRVNSRQIEK